MADTPVGMFSVSILIIMLIVIGGTMIRVRKTGNEYHMPKYASFGKIGRTIVLLALIFGALAMCSPYIQLP